jgi:hypothetical protein
VTAYKRYIVTKNCFQPLDNLHENDFPADALSVISQPGKNYCSAIKVRSARVKGESQMKKNFGKIHYHYDNVNFHNLDTKDNFTIPVIVKGQALTRKSFPIKRQSSNSFRSKDHKVLIIGDSHIRLCAANVKSEIKDSYDVQGLVKPGAGSGTLVNSANSDTTNLTKNDFVIFCGGANDVAKNSKMALRHIRNFINSNNHTNIILIIVPHRYYLMQSSCVNNEIRSFNRKRKKSVRTFKHASILEMTSDRNHFTKHGLHLNALGKEVLSKQMVSHVYAIQDQKKDPPIILGWNPDLSHTDTLYQGRVTNRTSTRTKKTPSTKSDDFLWQTQALTWEMMLTLNRYAKQKTEITKK